MMLRPRTRRQLAKDARISMTAAANFLKALHAAKCIHIDSYVPNRRGKPARVWAWGQGLDAPAPKPASSAERFRRYRNRRTTLEGAWKIPTKEYANELRPGSTD
jgi:hypothetical protein